MKLETILSVPLKCALFVQNAKYWFVIGLLCCSLLRVPYESYDSSDTMFKNHKITMKGIGFMEIVLESELLGMGFIYVMKDSELGH